MKEVQPTVYIRADANETIASGHIMRCLSIAGALRDLGFCAHFVLADRNPLPILDRYDYPYDVLDTDWKDADNEAALLYDYLHKRQAKVLLLDSYQVTPSYLEALSRCVTVLYLDDMEAFAYPVHTIINYSLNADRNSYLSLYGSASLRNNLPHFLLGAAYVPLREEFQDVTHACTPEVKNVLLTIGGSDPLNLQYRLLHLLYAENPEIAAGAVPDETALAQLRNLTYHVIVGAYHTHKNELYALATDNPHIQIHERVSNMSYYMTLCDVAISAGGSTLYELCACKTPTVCLKIADNQQSVEAWGKSCLLYAGDAKADPSGVLQTCLMHLYSLCIDSSLRESLAVRMGQCVDGYGARRIGTHIKSLLEN